MWCKTVFNELIFARLFLIIVLTKETAHANGECEVMNYSTVRTKCVWTEDGGNLTESEKICDHSGGAIFTFDSLNEGLNILDTLGVEGNATVFIGAILNSMNDSLYYDWLSRPGTWSVSIQSAIESEVNDSSDDSCLVFKNGTVRRENCRTEMTISVCEKDNCSCTNLQSISPSTELKAIPIEHQQGSTENPVTPPDFSLPKPDDDTTSVPDLGNIRVDKENKSTNYCDYVDVLNITFGDLIDQIFAQSNKENITGSSCQSQQGQGQDQKEVTTEDTEEVPEEKSTIPVTEVKFQFVSGIEFGPAMTGSMYNPPLRIDKHSQDYSLLVNISRELMEFQSTKHVTNQTLKSFAESVTNWTIDDGFVKETIDVQKDLFEDILQVGEDLVGNITTDQDDVKVSSGSIDVVSKIVKSTDNGTHTTFDLDQPSKNVIIRLSNDIFTNKSVKVRVSAITYNGMDVIAKRVDQRVASLIISVSVKYILGVDTNTRN